MYSDNLESLISAALADGVLTDKERSILMRKAEEEGIDADEFEMVLDARLVELQKKKELPKNEKVGNIRKCPNCGASLSGIISKCPECGFEFNNIKVANSVEELSKRLSALKVHGAKDSLASMFGGSQSGKVISEFPIPNTKEDLFELISYLETLKETLFENGDEKGSNAAHEKRKQCVKRANTLYPGDPMFATIAKESWWAGLSKDTRQGVGIFAALAVCIPIFFIGGKCLTSTESKTQDTEIVAEQSDVEASDVDQLIQKAEEAMEAKSYYDASELLEKASKLNSDDKTLSKSERRKKQKEIESLLDEANEKLSASSGY